MAEDYTGRKIMVAGPDHMGDIAPHIVLIPVVAEGTSILYRDRFQLGAFSHQYIQPDGSELDIEGPRRGWQTIEIIAKGLPLRSALQVAEEEAKKRNVAFYDNDDFVIWHPEGWKPLGTQ